MAHARHVALALAAVMLTAVPALAQPPVGLPSTTDSATGLPTTQQMDPRTWLPSPAPSSPLTTPAPPQPPPPIPRIDPSPAPRQGQPITPSTVDPRTGLPR